MPSSDPIQRFEDILENITRIEESTAGLNLDTFSENEQVIFSVKYALLSSAKRRRNWARWPLSFARKFHGKKYAGLGIGCGMITTTSMLFACGW